ncbi:leucine rich repeat [Seminavis robusta]|uniref:Leucine rich repeat n=1 Tax=Seminavis robusta TaxID=568900 RepID=A0A9N8DXF5_9STRA|nr:leucine rich repeat [Seminavis robusta]|eukprot:Sro449_g145380.1 leucine rich repeat (733) ;mRNA; f:51118-53400
MADLDQYDLDLMDLVAARCEGGTGAESFLDLNNFGRDVEKGVDVEQEKESAVSPKDRGLFQKPFTAHGTGTGTTCDTGTDKQDKNPACTLVDTQERETKEPTHNDSNNNQGETEAEGIAGAYAIQSAPELRPGESTGPTLSGGGGDNESSNSSSSTESHGSDLAVPVANPVDDEDLQQAQEYNPTTAMPSSARRKQKTKRVKTCLLLGAILLVALIMVLMATGILVPTTSKTNEDAAQATAVPTMNPSGAPSIIMSLEEHIKALLPADTLMAIQEDPTSPQSMAYEWLLEDDDDGKSNLHSDARISQKFALATLYFATSGDTWADNTNWLNHSIHECGWFHAPDFAMKETMQHVYPGYLSEFFPPSEPPPTPCNSHGIYQNLWLDRNNLVGFIPEELYMLSSLQTLSLGWNQLDGVLSTRLGQLFDLEGLAIFGQPRVGNIPSEIGLLTKLRGLLLTNSNHQGLLPSELWQLTNIETLALMDHKQMQGTIPSEVGHFSSLKWIVVTESDINGSIPTELGQIESLEWIVLERNRLSGSIPKELAIHANKLMMSMFGNDLVGTIPSELGLLTSLNFILTLRGNQLSGSIPSELGLLTNLQTGLSLRGNLLTGVIPTELGLLTHALLLLLDDNQLSGQIPSEFGELTSLGQLGMANNSLSGLIPHALSTLQESLHALSFNGNPLLSGTIPKDICSVHGTPFRNQMAPDSFLDPPGVSFDCSDILCGCNCSCDANS